MNPTDDDLRDKSARPMPADGYPATKSVEFEAVHRVELKRMRLRRRRILGEASPPPDPRSSQADAHVLRPFGLAFSGGGIRSATLNLGILQGLAEFDLLKYVDYLSTVSGGGYIGSWLHGVILKGHQGDSRTASQFLSPTDRPVPGTPQEDPISFLRKYSNYLAPKPGLFSTDSWVMVSIWIRNVLLNQLILLPTLSAVVAVALMIVFVEQLPVSEVFEDLGGFNIVASLVALVALFFANVIAWHNLTGVVEQTFDGADSSGKIRHPSWWERRSWWTVPLMFVAALVLGCADIGRSRPTHVVVGAGLLVLYGLLQFKGGFRDCYRRLHQAKSLPEWRALAQAAWMVPVSAGVNLALLSALWTLADGLCPWTRVMVAPPLVCVTILTGVSLLLGLMGADYPDAAREWLARIGTMLGLTAAGWLALFGIAVFGPWLFAYLLGRYAKSTLTAVLAWAMTSAAGVLAGRSSATDGTNSPGKGAALRWLIAVAPSLFMLGYLLLIALGVHQALVAATKTPAGRQLPETRADAVGFEVRVLSGSQPVQINISPADTSDWLATKLERSRSFARNYFKVLTARDSTPDSPDAQTTSLHEALEVLAAFWVVSVVIATIAGRRININEFSLHHFYKNRLVRCYLGASHGDSRRPNPLTGFDPQDDILLSDLVPIDENAGYFGPYAIVNATLNLNAGAELAQQERKAAAFVFTPEFCGFAPSHAEDERKPESIFDTWDEAGYRPTRGYSAPLGPHVGSAMAISGAAANPNSGYSTSGPMAFLLTVFDARLGWWLGNPRWREASRRPGPAFALWYLFAELLGQTTARTRFVNLSDGGHFDNLGLYELVRRRCRYIIIGDGEQDRELTFGSLGGAIRKCRADFGVEIDIDPDPIRIKGQYSTTHCVVGTITYPERDPDHPVPLAGGIDVKPATESARGWILYLKSSLTGDEPADVIEYRSRNPSFPHQSTADQFFSESQFESYRRLGLHIIREAFEDVLELRRPGSERPATPVVLNEVFQQLTTKWYAPAPVKPEAASRLNDAYSKVTSELGERDTLKPLLADLLADIHDMRPRAEEKLTEETFLYGVELLQLMENVFVEYGLEHTANRANPRNRGWMMIFRQWARTPFLYDNVWPRMRNSYNPLFRKFFQQLHDEEIDDVPIQT